MKTHKMRTILKALLVCAITFCISCNDDKTIYHPEYILAGQKSGNGIHYHDFVPDLKCFIANAYENQDTSVYLDLNMDGTNDYIFYMEKGHPAEMGVGKTEFHLIPLQENEICAVPTEYPNPAIEPCMHSSLDWVDTITAYDTISSSMGYYSKTKSLIYRKTWVLSPYCNLTEGFWKDIYENNSKYIGIKLIKENKNYYGWIGLWRNEYVITDYAITQEYQE